MRSTKIVTSFIRADGKLLILKRSDKVKSMKGLWAGVSGIIEKNEEPLKRAKIEIFEEVGITEYKITLVKAAKIHSRTGQHPGNNVPCTMCGGACVYMMLPQQKKYEKENNLQ